MSKETAEERLRRFYSARLISETTLKDDGVLRALDEIRAAATRQIEMSVPNAKETRDFAYTTLVVVRGIRESLQRYIDRHKQEELRQERANDPNRPKKGISL